jgi:hypothetical protein
MPPAGFEPAIPASEWPQTHALDRGATGIDSDKISCINLNNKILIWSGKTNILNWIVAAFNPEGKYVSVPESKK